MDALRRHLPILALALAGLLLGYLAGSSAGRSRPAATAASAEAMGSGVAAALRMPDTLSRAIALQHLMARLGPANVDAAAEAFEEVIVSTGLCDLHGFFRTWASFQPAEAFEYALALKAAAKRRLGVMQVASQWALRGGALEARQYAQSVPGHATQRAALTGLVQGWVRSGDVVGVTRDLARRPAGSGRVLLTLDVVDTLMRQEGLEAVMRWADGIPTDAPNRFKLEAFRNALTAVVIRNPAAAVAWWESQAEHPWAQESLWVLAFQWIPREPDAAMRWLRARPVSEARDEAIRQALRRWYEVDREPALAWLARNELPPEIRPALPSGGRRALQQVRQRGSSP